MGFADTLARQVRGTGARILILDIETKPHVAYVWGMWDQNVAISQLKEPGGTICFAAKWYGEKKVHFYSDHHDGHDEMVKRAWEMMDEADVMVGYNHRAFDVKHLNREFVRLGLGPPSPHKDIDLLLTARRRFKFPSNKLDYVSRELDIGMKVKHDGFEMWERCMAGDDRAWRKMRQYAVHDCRLTEELYDRLRPWVPNHPNLNMHRAERVSACHACGSDELLESGFHYTPTRAYKKFLCTVCKSYSRATHSEPDMTSHRKGAM